MGPRLLYVLLVGTVIVASLALRVWDPSPVARMRSLVFDAYQRVSPRAFDPSLPVRIVDIDEESLKKIGQWPWPRTVLAELVDKLAARRRGGDRLRHGVSRARPHVAGQCTAVLAAIGSSGRLQEEIEKLPSNDQVLRRGNR